jgi:hypothetical protein
MLYQLEKLNNSEKETVLNAPAYITVLIAGSDDNIQDAETKRALELVHIKSYSESPDISSLYKSLGGDFDSRLGRLLETLPATHAEREPVLTEELTRLSHILKKMDADIAYKYYNSLRSFASYIANAAGGFAGLNRVSSQEKKYMDLPMIEDPKA